MAANKNKPDAKPEPTLTTTDTDQELRSEMDEALAAAEKALADAKAEADRIIAEAKAQADALVANAPAPTPVLDDPSKDMVKVHLFKDNHRYKDDVFVGLNGRFYQIKRGVDVEVPRAVAEILEQSMAQDVATAELTEKLQAEYVAKAKDVGL